MLRKYRNALYEIIKDEGIFPELFSLEEFTDTADEDIQALAKNGDSVEVTDISINLSKDIVSSFYIVQSNFSLHEFGVYYYSAGKDFSRRRTPSVQDGLFVDSINFTRVTRHFRSWLNNEVKAILDDKYSHDLWSFISTTTNNTIYLNGFQKYDLSPLSIEEKSQIRQSIELFHKNITQEFTTNPQHIATIKNDLDYLVAATERLNKFDWQGLAISTIIGIIVTLSLDTEKGRQLWIMFQQAFSQVQKLIP